MRFDRGFKKHYPRLTNWIVENIPAVRHKSNVFDPFMRFAELNHGSAWTALTVNDHPPTIDAKILSKNKFGVHFWKCPLRKEKVFIARWFAKDFEKKDPDWLAMTYIRNALEATIMHEIVHWGDMQDGVEQPAVLIDGHWRDVGFQFEQEAYGAFFETVNW
jgi:hypothetical protein